MGGAEKWTSASLGLTTNLETERVRGWDVRGGDWWKDRAPEMQPSLISAARTSAELVAAVETRASATAWRCSRLRAQGRATIDAIS